MRNLVRKPLTWMVAAECVVVAILMLIIWNLLASATVSRVAAGVPVAPSPATDATPTLPALPAAQPPPVGGPLPGLNVDSGFWRSRLAALNHDQVFFEQLEWRVVNTATDAAQRYLETVVLPSVTRAERPSAGASLTGVA